MRTTIVTALASLIMAGSAAGACPTHSHALATWTEHNPGQVAEQIYGYADGATPGSTDFVYGAR